MSGGYSGVILHVDLTTGKMESKTYPEEFFRAYLGGGGLGAYFLLKGTGADTDPLAPENILTVAPGPAAGAAVSGVSRCSVTCLSPETLTVGDSQAGGSLGPFLKRAGLDALVISGRAPEAGYLFVHDGTAEFIPAPELCGRTVLEVHDFLSEQYTGEKVSILQCGPAGENLVRFACLASDLHDFCGRGGMGAVFGSKNLRAVVVKPGGRAAFADPEALKFLARKGAARVNREGVGEILKKYGTPGLLAANALAGNLSTHNYGSGFHPEYEKLDGSVFTESIGSKGTTCYGCAIGCRKTVKTEAPYAATDRLGGPEFETLGLLGANLEIMDPAAVAKANELCNNLGIDTISLGGLASYLCEALEQGAVAPEQVGIEGFGFGRPEPLFTLIERIARREDVGDVLADGFTRAVEHFGAASAPFAVHTKSHGFPVHMPQVKPSMALLYAVSPIGADHMSSEHDWIAADTGEVARGLGLFSPGEPESYGLEKARAITYSQFFYGLLDSLSLCMFVWGPGSVYTYADLQELIRAATGWQATFWELMKAGERRINMMRVLNLRRGFGAREDVLPEKMFQPLTGGPSAGRAVDRKGFQRLRACYYRIMGWDEAGVPTLGKLEDLDLAWTRERSLQSHT